MLLVIDRQGHGHCLYGEAIDLAALGHLSIIRASHVEPDREGKWWTDLSPVSGPCLGPFLRRSEAIAAEEEWLETHFVCAAR